MAETTLSKVALADVLDSAAQTLGSHVARFVGVIMNGQNVEKLPIEVDGKTVRLIVKDSPVLPMRFNHNYGLSLFGLVAKRWLGPWVVLTKQQLDRLSDQQSDSILTQFKELVEANNTSMTGAHGRYNQIDWSKPDNIAWHNNAGTLEEVPPPIN